MSATGILQSGLSRVRCEWGKEEHDHSVVHPVFGRSFRVRGLLAFTPGAEPLWYGEVPIHAAPGIVRFKAAFREDGPQPLGETEPGAFAESYLCDPWGMIAEWLTLFASSTGREAPRNMHGLLLRGGAIADVEFEPMLHALRAVIVRRGTFRQETLPVLGVAGLLENMAPAPKTGPTAFRWPWTPRS